MAHSTAAVSIRVNVVFTLPGNKKHYAAGYSGTNLVDVAKSCGLDITGICGGKMVCTSCHIFLNKSCYKKVGEPTDEELDILDLSLSVHPRLSCQIKITEDMEGVEFEVPKFSLK
ncbi:hypothetical protein BB561_003604 [Smittium simulii]|uniref:2Fe-2S ferredoxin-type domain-containing protein n=1 Tax=Smittium simulii TaxID=133385 RepID=A0A2T9YKD7_9FUNG|nr:hypothetical protein BB561_003604 [Smittium simulii]